MLHGQIVEKQRQLETAREMPASQLPVIDALNLESDRLGAFSTPDAELLEAFTVAAAISVEKAMRTEVRKSRPIPAIIADVHQTLVESMDMSRYVTAMYGILDPRLATFTYVNCGHNPPTCCARGRLGIPAVGSIRAVGMFGSKPVVPSALTLGEGDRHER